MDALESRFSRRSNKFLKLYRSDIKVYLKLGTLSPDMEKVVIKAFRSVICDNTWILIKPVFDGVVWKQTFLDLKSLKYAKFY